MIQFLDQVFTTRSKDIADSQDTTFYILESLTTQAPRFDYDFAHLTCITGQLMHSTIKVSNVETRSNFLKLIGTYPRNFGYQKSS